MIHLCHKCAGLLLHSEEDNIEGLLACECISSYYRGFEPELTRKEAIAVQIHQQESWIALYTRQGRSANQIQAVEQRKAALMKLLNG